jgi:inosine-uridine nucleoside N-ribohydrolase
MQKIIIDTDPGIDDILALLLAFASSELQVEAITSVSGNVSIEQTSYNALAFLEAIGRRDVPVARGSQFPLVREPIEADYYHGKNGVGEVTLPLPQQSISAQSAANTIIQRVLAAPGEITLVALGPLTNLALALRAEPAIVHAVHEVIIMGGALKVPGNITPNAEFNIAADPHAAHIVFQAGWPIRLVSLDVTEQTRLRREHLHRLRKTGNPVARLIEEMLEYNLQKFSTSNFAMHDPLSLAVAIRPDFITWENVYVAVELRGEHTMGATVAYFPDHGTPAPQPANVQASIQVDAEGFLHWYTERVSQYLAKK